MFRQRRTRWPLASAHPPCPAEHQDLAADIPALCADGQVKEFAGRLLVLSDGLGTALGAIAIFAPDGPTGIKPFS